MMIHQVINAYLMGGGNPNAHRYWGMKVTAVNGGANLAFGELELYDAAGNLLNFGITAQWGDGGHTTTAGQDLSHACDGLVGATAGNVGTTTDAGPFTLYFDLGTPVAVSFMRLVGTETSFVAAVPKDYELVYSDDASTFSTAAVTTNQTSWRHKEGRVLNNPAVPASYSGAPARSSTKWRVWAGSYYSDYFEWGQGEIEMYATIGGARQVPSSATATNTDPATSVANLYDNNSATVWASNAPGSTPPKYTCNVEYTFSSAVNVAQLGFTARNAGGDPSDIGRQMPREILMEFYDSTAGIWRYADKFYDANASYAAKGEQRKFASNVAV